LDFNKEILITKYTNVVFDGIYKRFVYSLYVHESVHRDTIMKVVNKMQLYRLIYYS